MGGKSSGSQVTGHRYYATVVKFIGFRIDKLLGVNFDKRKWFMHDSAKHSVDQLPINAPSLYGETEGGVSGVIDVHVGTPDQAPNPHYQAHDELISGFPYKSYLVFRGSEDTIFTENQGFLGGLIEKLKVKLGRHSFYHGNTNYMKDCLLWPKRTRVQNTGDKQWYVVKSEVGDGGDMYTEYLPEQGIDFIGDSNNNTYGPQFTYGTGESEAGSLKYTFYLRGPSAVFVLSQKWSFAPGRSGSVSFDLPEECIEIYSDGIGPYGEPIIVHRISLPPKKTSFTVTVSWSGTADPSFTWAWSTIRHDLYTEDLTLTSIPETGIDINPVHKIREIITNPYPWGMGRNEDEINDENFRHAADQIWDEGLGISWAIKDKDCIEAINELCHHIDAGVRINRNTGKYEVVLFRDEWDSEDAYTIDESQIKSIQPEITSADEIINHLDVSFYDRDNMKDGAFSISENGLIKTTGQVNAEDLDFPYFMHFRNAEIVAQWKLKYLSTPKWKGIFSTGSRNARRFQKYGVIELPWSKKWSGKIKARILNINLGNGIDNTVSIEFEEIVPKSGVMTGLVVSNQQNVVVLEPQPCRNEPFEIPYYLLVWNLKQKLVDDDLVEDPNYGLVGVVAAKPQPNSVYAIMMTHDGTPEKEWSRAATINYSSYARFDQIVSKTSHQIALKNSDILSDLKVGTLIKVGRDWLGTPSEWMSFESQDQDTGIITVKRGLLDTLPQEWGADTELFFCGTDIAYDTTEYYEGDKVLVSALTTTPSGILPLLGSTTIELRSRAIRPYPPANVKINGSYWPTYIDEDIVVTWLNRNRKQQTASTHLDWFDSGNVALEENTVTTLIVTEFDVNDVVLATYNSNVTASNTWTLLASAMDANTRKITIVLKTERDGFECLNLFEHSVLISNLIAPQNVSFEVIEL